MVNTLAKTQEFQKFLKSHEQKKDEHDQKIGISTHTRMPDRMLGIYGGSFTIADDTLPKFYDGYKHTVFANKIKEYFTEAQLKENGQMAVDLDFRYARDVECRLHTKEHVLNMVLAYLDEFKKIYAFDGNSKFDIFVMEKPNVNKTPDITKDGIHIIFGLKVDYLTQQYMRKQLIPIFKEEIDLPLVNSWESVLDEGISKGTTNWTLYGSRKPAHEAYELSYFWNVAFDPKDCEFVMNEFDGKDFCVMDNFELLSVRNNTRPKFDKKSSFLETEKSSQKNTKKTPKIVVQKHEFSTEETDQTRALLFDVIGTEKETITFEVWWAILGILKYNGFSKDLWMEWNDKIDLSLSKRKPCEKWDGSSGLKPVDIGVLQYLGNQINPEAFQQWKNKFCVAPFQFALSDWYTLQASRNNNSTEGANSELLFETEYDIANDLFAKLKERIVYTRKQVFFKHNNIWVYDAEIIKDVLLGYIMKQPYFYSSDFYEKKTKQIIQVKGKPANKSLKSGESLMALLMTIVRQHSDDTFYNKFIDTTKHKIAFNDGVLDIQKKTFTTWDSVTNFYSPIKINRNFQNVFDNQDKYKTACDDIKRRIISTLFGDKTESALNFFSRGLAGCYEDKNWSMFMGNRNSGKGVLDLLTKNALGNYYSSFDANNLLYERSSGEDKAKKMYWLLDLQFIRIAISQEVKTDVKSNLKIDGVTVKSMASGGDTLKARRNYDVYMKEFVITSAIMMMFNDMPAVEPADALETCYQFTSVSQFKSQEEIDDMNNQNCDPLMMKKYLVKDETIKDKCKSVEWSDAYILLLMDSFKEKPTPHNRVIDDADNTDLTFKIFESFKFDDNDSFVSFNEIKKWIDFEGINATLKKVKTELLGLGVKEHKIRGNRGFKGAFLKPIEGIGEDDATTEY